MSDLPSCPICATSCDISEEDLIDADCGACGAVTIHVHCKEKYCRQQGELDVLRMQPMLVMTHMVWVVICWWVQESQRVSTKGTLARSARVP
eukprot:3070899-Rhodomonas_salina.1